MSVINQVEHLSVAEVEPTKKSEDTPMYKRTLNVLGADVPYWLVALVVVAVVVAVVCWKTGRCTKQKVGLVNTGLTSVASPASSASVSSVRTDEVRAQLRELFEQF